MPKLGFKSITVSEHVYDHFLSIYNSKKKELETQGISSFTGYVQYLMKESLRINKIKEENKQFIEKISIELPVRILLKDNRINRIIEITIKNGLFCEFCKKNNCSHIGFAYSLHEIYPL